MKAYTLIKTGYTAGIYGWTGDYYSLVVIDGDRIETFMITGSYGVTQDEKKLLEDKGFRQVYANSPYGKLKRSDYQGYKFTTLEELEEWIAKGE